MFIVIFIIDCILFDVVFSCGPSNDYIDSWGAKSGPYKRSPLVQKQHVPNLHENTLGASGLQEGRIGYNDPEFKSLVRNTNPNIVFRHDRSGEDRIMSKRCNEMLNVLALLVSKQWPGVRIRVLKAWQSTSTHKASLHDEGRAVDIGLSDRDKRKYGMLARLAVEAGFDWVHYVSRDHVHCSVKSDTSINVRGGGCFSSSSTVLSSDWSKVSMKDLEVGDMIWVLKPHEIEDGTSWLRLLGKALKELYHHIFHDKNNDNDSKVFQNTTSTMETGEYVLTRVIGFLHRDPHAMAPYISFDLNPQDGGDIKYGSTQNKFEVSAQHLVYTQNGMKTAIFVSLLTNKQHLYRTSSIQASIIKVSNSKRVLRRGYHAPLTDTGLLMVDGVVVSCYSILPHHICHLFMTPLRTWHQLTTLLKAFVSWTQPRLEPFVSWTHFTMGKNLENLLLGTHYSGNFSFYFSEMNHLPYIHPYVEILLNLAEFLTLV